MPFAGDNAADEFVFVTSKVVAARATVLSSSSANSSPQAARRRLHLHPIPTHIDTHHPSPTDHRQKAFDSGTSSFTTATPLPPELLELLPKHLRENALTKFSRNTHRLPECPLEFVSDEVGPPARPPLPANYYSGDYSNILDKQESAKGPEPEHNYDYLSDLVTSDALTVLGRSPSHITRATSVTPVSLTSSSKTSHTPHHTAPAALGISSDSGISSGSSCSSSSMSSRSSSSKSLPRVDSKTSVSGRPIEPPASPKFCRVSSGGKSSSVTTSSSSNGCDPAPGLTQVSITAVLASDGERASMFRRLETSTPQPSPLLDSFRNGSSFPSPHSSPRPAHKQVAIATITTMGQTHPTHTQHLTTTTQPQQAKVVTSQPTPLQRSDSNPSSQGNLSHRPCRTHLTSSSSKPTKSILKDESRSVKIHKVAVQPLSYQVQQPLPVQLHQVPQTSIGSISRNVTHNRSAPSSPEMRRAWNQVGIPSTHVSQSQGSSPRVMSSVRGSSASPGATRASRSPSPNNDAIYDNIVLSKPGVGRFLSGSRPTASVPPTITPITTHILTQCKASNNNATPSSQSPPPTRRILTQAPVMINKSPSPPMQRRNTRSTTPTGGVCPTPPMATAFHYFASGDPNNPGGYWAPIWGSSPQLCSQSQAPAPCYTTYVCGHGGPPGPHTAYPMPIMYGGPRSHSCERLPPGVSAPNSPQTGRRSASPWRGGSASPVMARHSPSPDPGGAPSVGRPPRPRRPPTMRKSKTVEVSYLDLHPMSSSGPTSTVHGNQITVLQGASPAHAATPPTTITHYPYGYPPSFNVHASPYIPPHQKQNCYPQSGFLQYKERPTSPTPSVSSAMSLSSQHKSISSAQSFEAKEKVTYKRFYKCMKSFLKPAT